MIKLFYNIFINYLCKKLFPVIIRWAKIIFLLINNNILQGCKIVCTINILFYAYTAWIGECSFIPVSRFMSHLTQLSLSSPMSRHCWHMVGPSFVPSCSPTSARGSSIPSMHSSWSALHLFGCSIVLSCLLPLWFCLSFPLLFLLCRQFFLQWVTVCNPFHLFLHTELLKSIPVCGVIFLTI